MLFFLILMLRLIQNRENIKTSEVQFKEVGWFASSRIPYFGHYHWYRQKFFGS